MHHIYNSDGDNYYQRDFMCNVYNVGWVVTMSIVIAIPTGIIENKGVT